jgi:ATP synthase protein I
VDSSNVLDIAQLSNRVAVEPPPFISFRTKVQESSVQEVTVQESSIQDLAVQSATEPHQAQLATLVTNQSPLNTLDGSVNSPGDSNLASEFENSMEEYFRLKYELLLTTLLWAGLLFGPVWYVYSLNIALNFLLGAVTGVVYLGLLARNVERLNPWRKQVGKSQLAVFIGVIVVASQLDSLNVLPVFLGFLTYKVAILVYTLRTTVQQAKS